MTGRAYIEEVLILVWLKSIKSKLLDKQVNAQKESLKKYFQGLHKLLQAHEKLCNENERIKQEKKMCINMLLMEGSTL